MKRKGQLEIGVNIMVLLVVVILLIIALIAYFRFNYSSIKETRQEILDEKFSTLVNSLNNLPEIKCSTAGSERECLDAKKLIAFGKILKIRDIRDEYLDEFGVLGLEVKVVYPSLNVAVENFDCVDAYTSPDDCGRFVLIESLGEGLKYTTPVSLYYPDRDIYKIGELIITAEVK